MKIRRRLTLRFVLHSAIAGLVVLLIAAVTVYWVLMRLSEISLSDNFPSVGLQRLVESSKLGEDGIVFDRKLLELVKHNKGWLQSLDENGKVEKSYNKPSDVPVQYNPGELAAYWRLQKEFPYDVYLWIQEKHGRVYTLLYGVPKAVEPLLQALREEHSSYMDGRLILPEKIGSRIRALGGYVQLLDLEGRELAALNRPESIPDTYTVQELTLRSQYPERYEYRMSFAYDENTGETWVVGVPNKTEGRSSKNSLISAEMRIVLTGIAGMLGATLLIFALLSFLNALRFGAPMFHMLAWLDSLGRGTYDEPADRNGRPRSRLSSGKWRRRYSTFAEVMLSMDQLAVILRRDEERRRQTETLREEWITGITHDLKTPLSSIKGYAHLLAEDAYDWSPEEVRKFSAIMLEKSAHMDTLISDLAMTYRQRSGIHAPQMEEVEMDAWLGNALIQAAANPEYGEGRIIYQSPDKKITASIYRPWMERVVGNLTANALLHNSSDTQLTVILSERADGGLTIIFRDNGQGMDEQTAANLFERYYRGGDSASTTNGSGLGMAISKGLVEAMGGQITVSSAPGKGTEIRLCWDAPK
ncbi:HAMP domain-containing sensor histidine kinase [Paenibacillus graminis]|uniref:sensor histidine kinase n=1 Tax=Paenibacillus graminis TaxID=189425 RepID=UPI002DBDA0BB|nr:HAMP domain-containing sensor histidine kinase [Paenibacillus graminis]MEC0168330.1 HAMP domain-containing sensor histidine kinase [Paenibacillus graminis]